MRNDNSSLVEHVHSINPVDKESRLNGFLESNREVLDINTWMALSRIMGGVNIPDDMAQTTTQTKLVILLAGNIPKATSGGGIMMLLWKLSIR